MSKLQALKKAMDAKRNPEKAAFFPHFFKTGPGEYGEGDKFLGVVVPDQRAISKQFKDLALEEIQQLLNSEYHEHRLTGIFILVLQYQKAKTEELRKTLCDFYLKNYERVNNWDLVDSSAHKILGPYLQDKDRSLLYEWAESDHLWKQRIAMISCYYYIKKGDFKDALAIAEILVHHDHDLIHKAVGWMLREIGKKDKATEMAFLDQYYHDMPRTMLRYAIEKFPEGERKDYLEGRR